VPAFQSVPNTNQSKWSKVKLFESQNIFMSISPKIQGRKDRVRANNFDVKVRSGWFRLRYILNSLLKMFLIILTFYFRSSFPNVLHTSTPPHHLPTSERTKCNRHSFRFVSFLFCFVLLERRNFGVGRRNEIWMENERERQTERQTNRRG
jgi:hypothetical protein